MISLLTQTLYVKHEGVIFIFAIQLRFI